MTKIKMKLVASKRLDKWLKSEPSLFLPISDNTKNTLAAIFETADPFCLLFVRWEQVRYARAFKA